MNADLQGALNRAAAVLKPSCWVLQEGLTDNPYMKDRAKSALPENKCAVFINTRPDAVTPSYRAYTKAALLDSSTCSILDLVGIKKDLREKALNLFPSNVVSFNARMDPASADEPMQMVAGEPRHVQRQQQHQHQHQPK